MRQNRRRIVTAVLTLLLIIGAWLARQAARSERATNPVRVSDWQPQTWYQVDDHSPIATCELPAGPRYRLVLGCLGDVTQEHRVSLRLTDSRIGDTIRRTDNPVHRNRAADRIVRLTRCSNGLTTDSRSGLHGDEHHGLTNKSPDWQVRSKQPLVGPRDFFLHVTDGDLDDPKQYARITAHNLASGSRVRIFLDQQLVNGEVPQSRLDELVRRFDEDVIPRVESQFGPLSDVDGDGTLAVVLTPWLSRLQGGRTSIGGMVRSSDFQRDLSSPFSNRCDMLFLNSALPSDAPLCDLLSHEVAHAACISQRLSRGKGVLRDEEDWLSEALAHLAEPGWSNLDHRLVAFLDNPSRYPLVVPDYYRAGLWRDPGCRGATYLFTRWCVGREPHLLRELAQSTARGMRNLERTTGRRFEELFREWSLTLADEDELDSGDLQRLLQRLGCDGIQAMVVDTDSDEETLLIHGTAFAVVDVLVDDSSSRILRIAGGSAARWQFSICRCPDDSRGRSELNALATVKP